LITFSLTDTQVIEMSQSELNTFVALAQQSRYRQGTPGFIACRGEMQGQAAFIVYSFRDAASAAAFLTFRQSEANPLRLEILDALPREVREYHQ
jgi:hypothetical protein